MLIVLDGQLKDVTSGTTAAKALILISLQRSENVLSADATLDQNFAKFSHFICETFSNYRTNLSAPETPEITVVASS